MPTFKLGSNTLNTPSTAEATITGDCPAMGTPYVTQFNWNGTAWVGSAPVAGGTVGFTIPGMGADCSVSSCAGTVPWVGSWQFDFVNQTFSVCYNITFDGRCCGLPPGVCGTYLIFARRSQVISGVMSLLRVLDGRGSP